MNFYQKISKERKDKIILSEIKEEFKKFLISKKMFWLLYKMSARNSNIKQWTKEQELLKCTFENSNEEFCIYIKVDSRNLKYNELLRIYENSKYKLNKIEKDEEYLKESFREINNKINKYNSMLEKLVKLQEYLHKKMI